MALGTTRTKHAKGDVLARTSGRSDISGRPHGWAEPARLRSTRLAGAFLVLLGVTVLVGWVFSIENFTSIQRGLPPMAPATSVCFVFGGIVVILLAQPATRVTRLAIAVGAAGLAAFALFSFLEHMIGEPVSVAGTELTFMRERGVMPAHAAATFLLTALAVISTLARDPLGARSTTVLSIGAFAFALAALLGFVFGLDYTYGVGGRIALHTAIGLTVLSTAIVFSRPDCFPASAFVRPGPGAALARRLAPFIVLTPLALGILSVFAERAEFYNTENGVGIVTTATIILFLLVLAAAARVFDSSEQARAEAEQRFVAAFEGARTGLAIVRLSPTGGTIVQVNQALCDMTGREAAILHGSGIESLIAPEDALEHKQLIDEMAGGGLRDFTFEGRLASPARGVTWVYMHATLLDERAGAGRVAYVQLEDISARKEVEHRLEYLASHDALTSLLNRRRFDEEVERHIESCKRYGYEGTLVLMDLDNFKMVNDRLGHQTGDEVLRTVGTVLRERLRTTDIVSRLGGDEFALLLPHTDAEQAEILCTEILERIHERLRPITGDIQTTASAGVIPLRPGVTAAGAMARADVALYDSKESGKGRVSMYTAGSRDRAGDAVLPRRVRSALERGSFRLVLQPVVDLRSRAVRQYEVFLRMPEGPEEDTPADVIFATAKRLGLAVEIDRWVLTRVMNDPDLLAHTGPDAELSLNLAPDTLVNSSMPEWIAAALRTSSISPERMTFEIPEAIAMANVDAVARLAGVLRSAGCRVAIAQFGAALASFSHLRRVGFDYVKIDGGLVTDLLEHPQNQAVIKGLAKTAEALGKTTIGELVEDEDVARLLMDLGVEYGQGFHVGEPAAVSSDRYDANER